MDKEKFILQEHIKRIKELAGYDKSKTLMEQTAADLNIDRVNRAQLATAPVETTNNDAWIDQVYSKVPNSYLYKKMTFSNSPALQYDGNPNSTIIYTQNRWFQYPKGVTSGTPAIKGSWKLEGNTINAVKDAAYNKPATTQTPGKTTQTKTQVSITDPNTVNSITFDYTYPGDSKFVYGNQNGTWYGKNVTTNKVYDISKNYPSTAANLDKNAVKSQNQLTTNGGGEQSTTTATTPKKLTDMSSIELDIMKKNQPLDYKNAYDKLGAIEKKMVDSKATGKSQNQPTTVTTPKKLTDMSSIELDIMKKNQPLEYKNAYNKLGPLEKKMVDSKSTGK